MLNPLKPQPTIAPAAYGPVGATAEPTSLYAPEVRAIVDEVREAEPVRPLTPSPADWRDGWIYVAMLDRFASATQPPRHLPYDAPWGGFQGGTLEGLRQRLDYLQALGAGALWITPVLKNVQELDGVPNEGTYHGYGIQNFLAVDPRFAQDPAHADLELRRLVDDAHARGMYVILDIVLNHVGDVFAYPSGSTSAHSDQPLPIHWRDEHGFPNPAWADAEAIGNPAPDAALLPQELRHNDFFLREGTPPTQGPETHGDFFSLKQLVTSDPDVADALIRAYQYVIARFDIDGFRIDTLKFLDRSFARVFGNAMREFALSAGKKNFFTFGEVCGSEEEIARFIGRNTTEDRDETVGVDAALDFPLFDKLPRVIKGFEPPSELATLYQRRKQVEQPIVSSHGEATRYFVTFLDNHDQRERFRYEDPADPHRFDDQVTMALACQFALPGIPCVYYGTEQGLAGRGGSDGNVREALWGKPDAFDTSQRFYRTLKRLSDLRATSPVLRYGRFYFRQLSGDGVHFGISTVPQGVLAFSRILGDREVLVVANTNTTEAFDGDVIVDRSLNPTGAPYAILFGNRTSATWPQAVRLTGPVDIVEVDGSVSHGPAATVHVTLQPMEVQILQRACVSP